MSVAGSRTTFPPLSKSYPSPPSMCKNRILRMIHPEWDEAKEILVGLLVSLVIEHGEWHFIPCSKLEELRDECEAAKELITDEVLNFLLREMCYQSEIEIENWDQEIYIVPTIYLAYKIRDQTDFTFLA